jgi:hypothetical protein
MAMIRFAIIVSLAVAASVRAESLVFTLSPAQSRLTATASGSSFSNQDSGVSNVSNWSGRITVTIDRLASPLLLKMDDGILIPLASGSWSPGVGGTGGPAEASYGFFYRYGTTPGGLPLFGHVASRGLLISMRTPEAVPLARTNANAYRFLLSGTSRPRFVSRGSIDYSPSGGGTAAISQVERVGIDASVGTLTFTRGVARLAFPINFEMRATIPEDISLSLIPAGTITATTPIAAPVAKAKRRNFTTSRSKLLVCKRTI